MAGSGQNTFLMIIVIAVAVIVAAWLIHFVFRIIKTKKAYQEIMEKRREDALKNDISEAASEQTEPAEEPADKTD